MSRACGRPQAGTYTWEQAVEILRQQPEHRDLIRDSYLEADVLENCRRFAASEEFRATLELLRPWAPRDSQIVDIAAGNGIASYALALGGYAVTAVEPDPSDSVGRGAIELVNRVGGLPRPVEILDAWGEALPCPSGRFQVVYVRQGLHHARDLRVLVAEAFRVLAPDGLFVAAREPVVDSDEDLRTWLSSQPDHQLYGGENAFRHHDYVEAIRAAGGRMLRDIGPYDSIINIYPRSRDAIEEGLLSSRTGRLASWLPRSIRSRLAFSIAARRDRTPGRLHTFVAHRPSPAVAHTLPGETLFGAQRR